MRKNVNPFLMTDFYKISHRIMSEKGTEKIYSTITPRGSRIKHIDSVVVFGLQGFVKEFLIDYFNDNFFNKDKNSIVKEYKRIITHTLGDNCADTKHIEDLHDLGYIPIRICALEEGTSVPLRVPMATIENTNPEFYWLTNFLETLISSEIWKPCTSTTIVKDYYNICKYYGEKTCDSLEHLMWQCHNFSYRGMSGNDDAMKCGAGQLLYFSGTDTIPSISYLENYYGADVEKELIGASVVATEHSIQCGYQDDVKYINRMLDIVPSGILSVVSDGYDYWNVLENILPQVKDRIISRDGKYVVRPDSGNPVDIICGTSSNYADVSSYFSKGRELYPLDFAEILIGEVREITPHGEHGVSEYSNIYKVHEKYYLATIDNISWDRHDKQYYYIHMYDKPNIKLKEVTLSSEEKGSIEVLWDIFGGTINSKGYKVLDPHIGLIYGDAITPDRAKEIFRKLELKGFSSENIVFGIGSYSLGYYTRDTFAMAVKATYTIIDGKETLIFKDPKTDDGTKKSQRGMVAVIEDEGKLKLIDELYQADKNRLINIDLLKPIFENGILLKDHTLQEIRDRVTK